MKRGGPGKGGGQEPLTPSSGHAYVFLEAGPIFSSQWAESIFDIIIH